MANTFRVITHAGMSNSAGNPETIYTVPSSPSTTTVIIGLTLCNVTTSSVLIDVKLDGNATTSTNTGAAANNAEIFLAKDVPIAVGSSLELLTGGKVVLEAGDALLIDCSVADKLSGSLSVLEIT